MQPAIDFEGDRPSSYGNQLEGTITVEKINQILEEIYLHIHTLQQDAEYLTAIRTHLTSGKPQERKL